jgi:hypothetical protein
MSSGATAMVEFVKARLDELENDAALLRDTKSAGLITETWVKQMVAGQRKIIKLYEDNQGVVMTPGRVGAVSSLAWSLWAMADSFKGHVDYKPEEWY